MSKDLYIYIYNSLILCPIDVKGFTLQSTRMMAQLNPLKQEWWWNITIKPMDRQHKDIFTYNQNQYNSMLGFLKEHE